MDKCGVYTLEEATERFCIGQFNDARKGFDNYLVFAKDVWNDMLKNTLWAFRSVWLETYKSDPYPYIILPDNMEFFMGLYYEHNKRLIPVSASESFSLMPKPKIKKCGCKENCNCGGMCSELNTRTYSTKEHDIDGDTYIEKIWTEVCKNGDIKIWREVPTPNYNTEEPPEITSVDTVTDVQTVCKLETLPCGCVAETEKNEQIIIEHCGYILDRCIKLYKPQPGNETTIQFDSATKRLYLIGKDIKEWYQLHYRERNPSEHSMVPENCLLALNIGIDYYSGVINPRISRTEKRERRNAYRAACQKIVEELNPIDLEFIYKLQSQQFQLP